MEQRNSNLLPRSARGFTSHSYWDTFFTKRKEGFEWYGAYQELAPLLHKYISSKDKLLIVGCGNSELSRDLYHAGLKNQLNVDISTTVINQMKIAYPHLEFRQDDVTNLHCVNEEFSCVLDKGTFDALAPPLDESSEAVSFDLEKITRLQHQALKMLGEVNRVLKPAGRFVCISLLQPHVAELLIGFFNQLGWLVRVCRCHTAENSRNSAFTFPVYVCIFTKVKLPGGNSLIEFFGSEDVNDKGVRLDSVDKLIERLKDVMSSAYTERALKTIGKAAATGISINICDIDGQCKYVFHIADEIKLIKNPMEKQLAVFIVPQGRETEYLFGTHEGRCNLAIQAGYTRIVVVHLLRDRLYPSMDEVQEEVKSNLSLVIPVEIAAKGIQCPILTMEGDLGIREIVYRGKSEFSGDFVVEDVELGINRLQRRLIFLNSPNVIQSEVNLKQVKIGRSRGKGKKREMRKDPDSTVMTCDHHGIMSLSIGILKYFFKVDEEKPWDVLLIGLGGGLIVSFLHHFFPFIRITAVEVDKEIIEIAQKYFGLPDCGDAGRLRVIVDDGLKYVKMTEEIYNILLIDVDNKSVTEGLSCPPPEFLTNETLGLMKSRLKPEGLFVLNFVCRNRKLEMEYTNLLSSHFPFIYQYKLAKDVNTIFLCFLRKPPGNSKQFLNSLCKTVRYVRDVQLVQSFQNVGTKHEADGKLKSKPKEKKMEAQAQKREETEDNIKTLEEDIDIENMCRKFKILKV